MQQGCVCSCAIAGCIDDDHETNGHTAENIQRNKAWWSLVHVNKLVSNIAQKNMRLDRFLSVCAQLTITLLLTPYCNTFTHGFSLVPEKYIEAIWYNDWLYFFSLFIVGKE
jgi:hypothetical protein